MKKLILIVLCHLVALAGLRAMPRTDTLVVNNGNRQLFGILSRPDTSSTAQLPIAIIAHGFNGDHQYGRNYFEPLAKAGYMCYTFDFPCGGVRSAIDNNTVNMSIVDEVSDMKAAVEYFAKRPDVDKDRITLVGESQGGLVAYLTAAEMPGRIDKLILAFAALGIPDNYNSRFRDESTIPDTTYIWRVPIGKRFFTELRDIHPSASMPSFSRPVLLLHGEKDPVVPLSSSVKASEMLPDATLRVIPGAGHGFKPAEFGLSMRHVTDFLLGNDTPTDLESVFLAPGQQHRPLIIWQWMDGLVTRDGITRDLEAFKEAGLAGVQNFQIGGPLQTGIGDPDNAIGSENWKALMRWALDECQRLGLTFGTHNCPGWSSSAYPDVRPEYSMQKLVYTETRLPDGTSRMSLPRPEVDPQWDYYRDVAVMAVPHDSVASPEQIVDLTPYFDAQTDRLSLPGNMKLPTSTCILRIGQTTNGKTNFAQAPPTGRGLECDKLSREAVLEFWKGYPTMVLEIAGEHTGKTFTHFEIDSYEAGGQTWSSVLPSEFKTRAGYDIMPWLPYMIGRVKTIGDKETTDRFLRDWAEVVRQCVAENYYGYMSQLADEAGVKMLIEPYGTGGQGPFGIIDFEKIALASPTADIATEFWQAPDWGWKDMKRHETVMRRLRRPLLVAEAFTAWPMKAWKDSPATIKPRCDLAFCSGVNKMMLHAGAANPWPGVLPGMSFGIWGTHFVPGQTWWRAGGAKALFGYMARCQSLLQQGLPSKEQIHLKSMSTYRRTTDDADIIFVCNPTDTAAAEVLPLDFSGRHVEIWDPYTCAMHSHTTSPLRIDIEPYGSRFVIVRDRVSILPEATPDSELSRSPLHTRWEISFPEIGVVPSDTLFSWPEYPDKDIRYFSGTATYRATLPKDSIKRPTDGKRLVLSLGSVECMASVKVNGKSMPTLWKRPYECDITDALADGDNTLEIAVTNLWPNRMIGDEHEPDDLEWSEPYRFNPQTPDIGRFLGSNPEWLRNGTPRPSKGRKTVGCFKFFKADSPLLPSGMLGPIELVVKSPAKR